MMHPVMSVYVSVGITWRCTEREVFSSARDGRLKGGSGGKLSSHLGFNIICAIAWAVSRIMKENTGASPHRTRPPSLQRAHKIDKSTSIALFFFIACSHYDTQLSLVTTKFFWANQIEMPSLVRINLASDSWRSSSKVENHTLKPNQRIWVRKMHLLTCLREKPRLFSWPLKLGDRVRCR